MEELKPGVMIDAYADIRDQIKTRKRFSFWMSYHYEELRWTTDMTADERFIQTLAYDEVNQAAWIYLKRDVKEWFSKRYNKIKRR